MTIPIPKTPLPSFHRWLLLESGALWREQLKEDPTITLKEVADNFAFDNYFEQVICGCKARRILSRSACRQIAKMDPSGLPYLFKNWPDCIPEYTNIQTGMTLPRSILNT